MIEDSTDSVMKKNINPHIAGRLFLYNIGAEITKIARENINGIITSGEKKILLFLKT